MTVTIVLALATLGDATQIGSFLLAKDCHLSLTFSNTNFANVHEPFVKTLFIARLSVLMLRVDMLNVFMLSVIMLSVIMLSVKAPKKLVRLYPINLSA